MLDSLRNQPMWDDKKTSSETLAAMLLVEGFEGIVLVQPDLSSRRMFMPGARAPEDQLVRPIDAIDRLVHKTCLWLLMGWGAHVRFLYSFCMTVRCLVLQIANRQVGGGATKRIVRFWGGEYTIEHALQNQFWRAQKVGLLWSVPVS